MRTLRTLETKLPVLLAHQVPNSPSAADLDILLVSLHSFRGYKAPLDQHEVIKIQGQETKRAIAEPLKQTIQNNEKTFVIFSAGLPGAGGRPVFRTCVLSEMRMALLCTPVPSVQGYGRLARSSRSCLGLRHPRSALLKLDVTFV